MSKIIEKKNCEHIFKTLGVQKQKPRQRLTSREQIRRLGRQIKINVRNLKRSIKNPIRAPKHYEAAAKNYVQLSVLCCGLCSHFFVLRIIEINDFFISFASLSYYF